MGLDNETKLACALLVLLIILFVVKNAYLLFLVYRQNTFISRARNDMISRVMREFLNRPYEDYLGADIPTVFRITDSDIPTTFTLMLSLLSLSTELVVSMGLGMVLALDPADAEKAVEILNGAGEKAYVVGKCVAGEKGVTLC